MVRLSDVEKGVAEGLLAAVLPDVRLDPVGDRRRN